jgi:hypothetical protein
MVHKQTKQTCRIILILIGHYSCGSLLSTPYSEVILFKVGNIWPVCREGCHCRDRMVVGFTTTCAISAYHH